MSYEESEPAKYEWKKYAVSVKIDNKQFDDIRNVQTYLRIKQRAKQALHRAFSNATTDVGMAELFRGV